MEAKLTKWGNSIGIRIPSSLLKSLELHLDDKVTLLQEDDHIIITKSKSNKMSLEEKFRNYKGENLSKNFTWDEPVGREIW